MARSNSSITLTSLNDKVVNYLSEKINTKINEVEILEDTFHQSVEQQKNTITIIEKLYKTPKKYLTIIENRRNNMVPFVNNRSNKISENNDFLKNEGNKNGALCFLKRLSDLEKDETLKPELKIIKNYVLELSRKSLEILIDITALIYYSGRFDNPEIKLVQLSKNQLKSACSDAFLDTKHELILFNTLSLTNPSSICTPSSKKFSFFGIRKNSAETIINVVPKCIKVYFLRIFNLIQSIGGYQSFFVGTIHKSTIEQIKELVQNCYIYLKVIEDTLGFDRYSNERVQLNKNVNNLNRYIKQ